MERAPVPEPLVRDQSAQGAGGVGAPAESDQHDPVARGKAPGNEGITSQHACDQPGADSAPELSDKNVRGVAHAVNILGDLALHAAGIPRAPLLFRVGWRANTQASLQCIEELQDI